MILIKNKRFLFLLISAAIIIAGNSCKKTYLDVNNDPNRVTDATVTAELIFPAAATEVGGRVAATASSFFDEWMGYAAPNGGFVPQQNIISYNIDFTFGDAAFQNYYSILFDLHQAEVKALDPTDGNNALAGACIILSAKLFQEVVDQYGDVPYSQAFKVDQTTTPTYDKSQDIYNDLLKRLDTAIIYMGLPKKSSFSSADIINHGDALKWIAFANTLKLRLLIRQSQVSGFDPSAEITKIQATGGVLQEGQSISVNPGYSNDVAKQNPYYAANGWSTTGVIANNSTNANAYIINILEATSDPREGRFFFPAAFDPANGFVGNIFGDPVGSLAQSAASSYFGPALIGNASLVNGTIKGGIPDGSGAKQDQFIYPSYESLFLYAEAVARGWIPGDAQVALDSAITESFRWTGVPDPVNAAQAYIAGNPDITTATVNNVAYQKYIANTNIDPLESFLDQNRLHFLTDDTYISTLASKVSNSLPLRLLYPQSEYTTNSANTPKQVAGDAFTSKLFWEP